MYVCVFFVRGFFPRGGGEVHVFVHPVAGCLRPVTMTERGVMAGVKVEVFRAGNFHPMASDGEVFLRSIWLAAAVTVSSLFFPGLGLRQDAAQR